MSLFNFPIICIWIGLCLACTFHLYNLPYLSWIKGLNRMPNVHCGVHNYSDAFCIFLIENVCLCWSQIYHNQQQKVFQWFIWSCIVSLFKAIDVVCRVMVSYYDMVDYAKLERMGSVKQSNLWMALVYCKRMCSCFPHNVPLGSDLSSWKKWNFSSRLKPLFSTSQSVSP